MENIHGEAFRRQAEQDFYSTQLMEQRSEALEDVSEDDVNDGEEELG